MHLSLILNSQAGTLRGQDAPRAAEDIAAIFRDGGHSIEVELVEGDEVFAAIKRVCADKAVDALIVGGGDGTISSAAAEASRSGMTLGILPLGTMNLFARSLGIPLEMKAAAAALAEGVETSVDIADVNGRFFVHHVTLGLHAEMIKARERLNYASRLGKIWASCKAWWFVVRQPPRLGVSIQAGPLKFQRRTAAVLVSNNPLGEGHLPFADDPKRGTLGLYVVKSRRPSDLLKLMAGIVLGRISANPQLDTWLVGNVEIRLREPRVEASVDGEIVSLQTPIACQLHSGGLRVLKPRDASEAAVAAGRGASTHEGNRRPALALLARGQASVWR